VFKVPSVAKSFANISAKYYKNRFKSNKLWRKQEVVNFLERQCKYAGVCSTDIRRTKRYTLFWFSTRSRATLSMSARTWLWCGAGGGYSAFNCYSDQFWISRFLVSFDLNISFSSRLSLFITRCKAKGVSWRNLPLCADANADQWTIIKRRGGEENSRVGLQNMFSPYECSPSATLNFDRRCLISKLI